MRFIRKQCTIATTLLFGLTLLAGGCGGGGGGGDIQTPPVTYKISGTTDSPDATVAITGAATATVTADGFGNYSTRLPGGSYNVTPARTGQIFQPLCQAVSIAGNLNGINFAATSSAAQLHTVSGQVKNGSTAIPWMKIHIVKAFAPVSGSTFTDSSGTYQFAGVPDGEYVISADVPPAYATYLFDRDIVNYLFTVSGADLPGQNFTAVPRGNGSATVDF